MKLAASIRKGSGNTRLLDLIPISSVRPMGRIALLAVSRCRQQAYRKRILIRDGRALAVMVARSASSRGSDEPLPLGQSA
jgi:hypothetical protein